MLAPQPQPVVRNQIVDSIEAAASLKEILSIACGAVRAGLQEGGAMRARRIKRGFFRLGIGLAMLCALLAFFNLFASTPRAARNAVEPLGIGVGLYRAAFGDKKCQTEARPEMRQPTTAIELKNAVPK